MKTVLDLDLLHTFVTVTESGGFSQAATRLMRGQSAVSLQIKRLEEMVGTRLLDRSPRHISLTPAGETLLDQARRMLAMNDEIVARIAEPELEGIVRFGAPEDFATSHLPQVLSSFAKTYPRIALEVTCELTLQLLERFQAGGLDLALVKREPVTGPVGRKVWREPLVWVAGSSRPAFQNETIPLVVSPIPCVYRKRAIDALDAGRRQWRIAYTCGSLSGNHAAVRAGLGVTVLPQDMVPHDLSILNASDLGLPELEDTEIALIEAPPLSTPAERLREYIVKELEHGRFSAETGA